MTQETIDLEQLKRGLQVHKALNAGLPNKTDTRTIENAAQAYLAIRSNVSDDDLRMARAALKTCPWGSKSHREPDEIFEINDTLQKLLTNLLGGNGE